MIRLDLFRKLSGLAGHDHVLTFCFQRIFCIRSQVMLPPYGTESLTSEPSALFSIRSSRVLDVDALVAATRQMSLRYIHFQSNCMAAEMHGSQNEHEGGED